VFTRGDDLILAFQIHGFDPSADPDSRIAYTLLSGDDVFREISRTPSDYPDLPDVMERISLADFPPAHYTVRVTVLVAGREVLKAGEEFDVTHAVSVPRPWTYSKLLAQADHPVYAFLLGSQFFRTGSLEPARTRLQYAHGSDPGSLEYSLELARVYLALEDYVRIPALLSPFLKMQDAVPFELYFMLGRAHQSLSDWSAAVEVYEKALAEVGANTLLLNALGECLYRAGRRDAALATWERSLEIDTQQPSIRKLVAALRRRR
jgi:tetratricopeptide (TPR) repeat protein